MLPNGPEMAVAILAVAVNATCAPMNPAYGFEEFCRYLADLRPVALITEAGIEYTILDDYHFRNAGLREEELHSYYLTEDEGRRGNAESEA